MATNSTSTDRVKISSDYNILFFANAPFKIDWVGNYCLDRGRGTTLKEIDSSH